jgi:Flp pilus assembly protein TadD
LDRFGQSDDLHISRALIPLFTTAPTSLFDADRFTPWLERVQRATPQGGLLFRTGRTEEAIARLRKSAEHPGGDALTEHCRVWLMLALAQHQRGDAAEARRWLARAVRWLDEDARTKTLLGERHVPWYQVPWYSTLPLELLRAEAEALIGKS